MDEALLSYYNRELAYLRKLGAEFAEKHPKIAGRLRLDRYTVEDPHVSRLIESFAFLTARIRHKLDDSFPELTEALMGLLYPDYHAPIPSLSIARFYLLPQQRAVQRLPAGTPLQTNSNPLGKVRYRTCYDTEIYPLRLTKAQFFSRPFQAPPLPDRVQVGSSQAVLRFQINSTADVPLAELQPTRLRLYLNGQPQLTFRLYEFLCRHATAVALAEHPKDPHPVFHRPSDCLQPVGFQQSEAVLPESGRNSTAHRLLSEYFVFPEKFLFIDFEVPSEAWTRLDSEATIYIYFAKTHAELVQGVSEDNLLLGCTPIINLFQQRLASLNAGKMGYEAKLCVDTGHDPCADIHTLEEVYATNWQSERKDLQPFYGSHRAPREADSQPLYWSLRREIGHWHNGRISHGIDCYLSIVDSNFNISSPGEQWHIHGSALCTNRDLPNQLPFGPGEPKLSFWDVGPDGLRIDCVSAPTPTLLPRLGNTTRWQLVTQLSLQHFSGEEGLQTLKETLRLYDFQQIPESGAIINGLVGLKAEFATARVRREGRAAYCQGTRIELELDEQSYSGSGIYLFSAVLSEFFAQYSSINSFVQLIVNIRQRPEGRIEWPPRSGTQALL